jgi:hypothetical protein
MSRNNSTNSFSGFSVHQRTVGSSLEFVPALGTQQLDDLINAYVPGSASIKEKRATVSMDFCEFSSQTGQTYKFYPVFTTPFSTSFGSATGSPSSSAAMQDSGYGSNFHPSPAISNWSWSQPSSFPTPSSADSRPTATSSPRKSSGSSSKAQANDFSHLPGMKIMTKDGLDVTNSASRGCKTKEQRDHAHLMRIIKACDACRRKKIRCDPSHRKRAAPHSEDPSEPVTSKKSKKRAEEPRSAPVSLPSQDLFVGLSSIPAEDMIDFSQFTEPTLSQPLEPWDEFIVYDQQPAELIPFDYDFFSDPAGHFSPVSATSSVSPPQLFTPTDSPPAAELHCGAEGRPAESAARAPTLPYLDREQPANSYVDFNLYSPASSIIDDDQMSYTEMRSSAPLDYSSTCCSQDGVSTYSNHSSLIPHYDRQLHVDNHNPELLEMPPGSDENVVASAGSRPRPEDWDSPITRDQHGSAEQLGNADTESSVASSDKMKRRSPHRRAAVVNGGGREGYSPVSPWQLLTQNFPLTTISQLRSIHGQTVHSASETELGSPPDGRLDHYDHSAPRLVTAAPRSLVEVSMSNAQSSTPVHPRTVTQANVPRVIAYSTTKGSVVPLGTLHASPTQLSQSMRSSRFKILSLPEVAASQAVSNEMRSHRQIPSSPGESHGLGDHRELVQGGLGHRPIFSMQESRSSAISLSPGENSLLSSSVKLFALFTALAFTSKRSNFMVGSDSLQRSPSLVFIATLLVALVVGSISLLAVSHGTWSFKDGLYQSIPVTVAGTILLTLSKPPSQHTQRQSSSTWSLTHQVKVTSNNILHVCMHKVKSFHTALSDVRCRVLNSELVHQRKANGFRGEHEL